MASIALKRPERNRCRSKSDALRKRANWLILQPPSQRGLKGFDNVDVNAADCSCIPVSHKYCAVSTGLLTLYVGITPELPITPYFPSTSVVKQAVLIRQTRFAYDATQRKKRSECGSGQNLKTMA